MTRFKFSLFYGIILLALSFFHHKLQTFILKSAAGKFSIYIIYGIFIAFFLVIIIKSITAGKDFEIGVILLTLSLIFYFLLTNPQFSSKLSILELFILGLIIALENRKARSFTPYLLLIGFTCLVELVTHYSTLNTFHFNYLNAWKNSLMALSGYAAGNLTN